MTSVAAESAVDLKLYELLEEFMTMLRRGQSVPVREFAKRYPEYASRIVADFPALLMAEGLKPRLSMVPGGGGPVEAADAPELLAGYRVIRQIGQGGMGIVYEAEHPRLSRRLAVKVLLGRKGSTNLAERFKREAESVARLNHPNIVPVFDFGEQNGVHYIAMPLIDGQSLDQMVEQYRATSRSAADTHSAAGLLTMVTNQPWSKSSSGNSATASTPLELIGPTADFKQLAKLGADVASALVHAHENKTIHRDIKPGNLILDKSGKIWVTDFGLAKVRDDESDLSRTGDVIGTPRFMAPEQMRGLCDERSDVYSLGITLYEMASGIRAWDSLNAAQLLKVRASAELPELSEHAPFVPKPLAEIIMRASSYRPEDRYQSAKELELVLNRFAHGQRTGDRRRRARNGGSFLDRRWVIGACSLGVPTLTFAFMYLLSMGPWAPAQLTTPEALISLVQDETQREKVVEQMPDLIEAAITSKDEKVREQAADLTIKLFEEALRKSDASTSKKKEVVDRVTKVTDQFKKTGFVYDEMDHPLTNAIRNLDLAHKVSELTIPAGEKLAVQAKLFGAGEAIRGKLFTAAQIKSLLALLPVEAQTGVTPKRVSETQLVRFVTLLDKVCDSASRKLPPEQQEMQKEIEKGLAKSGIKVPKDVSKFKLPKDLKISSDQKKKFLQTEK